MADKKVPITGISAALDLLRDQGKLGDFLSRWDGDGYELTVPAAVYDDAMKELGMQDSQIFSGSGTCKLCLPRRSL